MKPGKTIFQLWVRRNNEDPDRFELRFSIAIGKAFLRTTSFTGVGSTPVSDADTLPSLTAEEITKSEFIHVMQSESQARRRSEYRFAPDTIVNLNSVGSDTWHSILSNENNILTVRPLIQPITEPLNTPQKRSPLKIKKRHKPVRKSASSYIDELESNLERSKRHIQQLKIRIAALESQVEEMGGTVAPVILDYND